MLIGALVHNFLLLSNRIIRSMRTVEFNLACIRLQLHSAVLSVFC